jgi:PPOX class probable F420-dependent enzyme
MLATGRFTDREETPVARLNDAQRAFIQDNPFVGVVTTLRADGSPHSTVVWVHATDEAVEFNTPAESAKARHIAADPRITLVVVDPAEMYRWVGVSGTATVTADGADEHIDMLAKKFLGADTYPFRRPDQTRLRVTIAPESISGIGFSE